MGHSVLLWLFLYVAFIKCIAYFVHFAFMDTFLLILRYSTFMSWPHTLFFAKSNIIAFDKLLFYVKGIKSNSHLNWNKTCCRLKNLLNGVFLSTWKHDVAHKFLKCSQKWSHKLQRTEILKKDLTRPFQVFNFVIYTVCLCFYFEPLCLWHFAWWYVISV